MRINIQKIAGRIHKVFDLGSISRMDFIVFKNTPYILEVNIIPGLTSGSLMPKQAKAAGISFNEFIEILVKSAK
jgi:D-alanine-D-alanine ligase